jgi:hypothetical protein
MQVAFLPEIRDTYTHKSGFHSCEDFMTDQTDHRLTRRNLMKLISAGAGAVALANLPLHWAKPVVKMGLLPVHAQSTTPTPPPATYVVTAGEDDTNFNFCGYSLDSTASITPGEAGITLTYSIVASLGLTITSPASLTGTVNTTAGGATTLHIEFTYTMGEAGNITVTWGFDNPSQGTNTDAQTFSSLEIGC